MRDTVDGINEGAFERAMGDVKRAKKCPKGFRYGTGKGRLEDYCTPRIADGRCIWCQREMQKAGR